MNENKEHELLGLYRLLVNLEEEYTTSGSILEKQKLLDDLRNIREEINQLEEELEKGSGSEYVKELLDRIEYLKEKLYGNDDE
jgi:ribosome assembly protein YihI (activator of Der GTPase)